MRARSVVVAALFIFAAVPSVALSGPAEDAIGCDPIDPAGCLVPFPNDFFTVTDETSETGLRLNLNPLQGPRALGGTKPVFIDEVNRNDGFSPGSMILSFVPGLDLHRTWGEELDHISDLSWYARADAPLLVINAKTGERHPFWSELDMHQETGDEERLLIMRPAVNFEEATRYLVALRSLKDANGDGIPAGSPFTEALGGERIGRIADEIEAAEGARGNAFDQSDLYLAWEFTVASAENLAGRALHIRDDAFSALGDTDLANGVVEGNAPAFRIDRVVEDGGQRFVHGTFDVPNYLIQHVQTDDLYDPTGQVTDEQLSPLYTPHSRFFIPPGSDMPAVNPVQPAFPAKFTCRIPSTASAEDPARLTLMGHGLLGQRYEVGWNSGNLLTNVYNSMYCGTEWVGMAFGDIPQAVSILLDPSLFPSLSDRAQQGYVNFMYLGRLMLHPDGLAGDALFQDGGEPLIDLTRLVYDGNSQGGIMGGALAALSPDATRFTLGVPGMNYSTLLHRSVDWEESGSLPVSYGDLYYASIPDPKERLIGMALIQILWDRAEADGFAHHMTDDPYPNTPAHQVMLHVAYGDYQVANVSAEVEARTIGAHFVAQAMPAQRHWSADPLFGFENVLASGESCVGCSALVYWDSGNLIPPNANVPPDRVGSDPHEHPRRDIDSGWQRVSFFDTGWIHDTGPGSYCTNPFDEPGLGPRDWQGGATGVAYCPNA